MIARLLAAIQFLTVLPAPRAAAPSGQGAVFFPVIGAALGSAAGGLALAASRPFGRPLAALLAIALLIAVTGALHEDGLADVADAFRAGRTRERILAILKDSRIGTYGGLALVLSVGVRWQALAVCPTGIVPGLAASLALSRASLVVLAAVAPPLVEGLGSAFAREISRPVLFAVIAQAAIIAVLCESTRGAIMILASAMIVLGARVYFLRRAGGVNGDCLGATCQAVETANLLILAWQPSS